MSCDDGCAAEQVLDAILQDLDENRVCKQIDEPVETVFQAFMERLQSGVELPPVGELFAQVVESIYRDALRAPWKVADPRATTMILLERHYKGPQSVGYHAAVVDAAAPAIGSLILVLTQVVEIIRTRERQEYVESVFARRLDPSNWRLRCEIVEILRERYRSLLPPDLLACEVWQLVDEISAMILRILSSGSTIAGIASPHRNPPSH